MGRRPARTTRMTRLFYEKYVPQDPLLAPLFATMSADHPERVAKWLGEVFCGPKRYSDEYGGYSRMLSQHLGKYLTEEQRARWVALLLQSAHDAGLPNDAEFRSTFGAYIEWGSRLAVENSQTGANPPEHMPMPHWDWNTAAGRPVPGRRRGGRRRTKEMNNWRCPPRASQLVSATHQALFRPSDRQSMTFAFDLWSYEAVSTHADAILDAYAPARCLATALGRKASSRCSSGGWRVERLSFSEPASDGQSPRSSNRSQAAPTMVGASIPKTL